MAEEYTLNEVKALAEDLKNALKDQNGELTIDERKRNLLEALLLGGTEALGLSIGTNFADAFSPELIRPRPTTWSIRR